MAKTSGVQRDDRISSPEKSNIRAAIAPNTGAVRKKRAGTDIGGVCCNDRLPYIE